ncbi:putative transposable element encoded protein, partial [Trachipleistophora hominis]
VEQWYLAWEKYVAARLAPLQRVIDHALKDVPACGSSYYRKAAYQKLRIVCVAMWAVKSRTCAFLKWKANRTTIGELMNQPFKCSSATWITGTSFGCTVCYTVKYQPHNVRQFKLSSPG